MISTKIVITNFHEKIQKFSLMFFSKIQSMKEFKKGLEKKQSLKY